MNRKNLISWLAIMAMSLAILIASYVLGPPERKLPPRDYLPVLMAAAWVAFAQWRDSRHK